MNEDEIMRRVTEIFRDVLDQEALVLQEETTARDVDGWDSLSHISLIVSIEKEFGIRFDLTELKPLKNVGDMLRLIQNKVSPV